MLSLRGTEAKDCNSPLLRNPLNALGLSVEIREFDRSTRTASDAAAAIGCDVAQIAKSLVFKGQRSGRGVLVIASGANRVDEERVAQAVDEPIEKADADYVRGRTGFAIGGVPPVGHVEPIDTFVDAELMRFEEIWAAAGTPRAVFRLTPRDLVSITRGRLLALA